MKSRESVEMESLDLDVVRDLKLAEMFSRLEFEITSGYRDGDERCHGTGRAVDIACGSSQERFAVIRGLLNAGFCRVGLYTGHIHADKCKEEKYVQDVLWLGGASK